MYCLQAFNFNQDLLPSSLYRLKLKTKNCNYSKRKQREAMMSTTFTLTEDQSSPPIPLPPPLLTEPECNTATEVKEGKATAPPLLLSLHYYCPSLNAEKTKTATKKRRGEYSSYRNEEGQRIMNDVIETFLLCRKERSKS